MDKIYFNFKAKDFNNKWKYGDLIIRKNNGIKQYYIYDNDVDETAINDYHNENECSAPIQLKELFNTIDPITICQFTRLFDKNNTEIYEFDIAKYNKLIFYYKGMYRIYYLDFLHLEENEFNTSAKLKENWFEYIEIVNNLFNLSNYKEILDKISKELNYDFLKRY